MKKTYNQRALPAGRQGFTLFELLVSISIIAILTAIASMSFSGAQKKARDSRRISDMNSVQKAAEQFYSFNNYSYPPSITTPWTTVNGQTVLDVFPADPKGVGWTAYTFNVGATYCACATLESATGNSNTNTCAAFVNGTGTMYCVKNQQ